MGDDPIKTVKLDDEANSDSTVKPAVGRPRTRPYQPWTAADRIISTSGYMLIIASVLGFLAAGLLQLLPHLLPNAFEKLRATTWIDLFQQHSESLTLLVMAVVAAYLGKQLLTTANLKESHTIPVEDLPLIRQAVLDGKPEPIDQYVRLRSLSGMSGNFTKMGITGLPLTTVLLTLIFSFISLLPVEGASDFLDLAKLTLGAFIGSFVQRQVEQRRHESRAGGSPPSSPDLVA